MRQRTERTVGASVTRRTVLLGGVGALAVAASTGTTSAQDGQQTTVDMTDSLVFDPAEVTVAPGGTVVWENVGQVGHSVTAYEDEIPAEATYFNSADADSEEEARSAYPDEGDVGGGETFEHTFDVEGTYNYFCIPHESAGMVGSVTVAAGGGNASGGGGLPVVGDDARLLGLVALLALLFVVGFTFFLLKYGGDYEQ